MTTTVLVLSPSQSLHDAIVTVQKRDAEGVWLDETEIVVPPNQQSDPIHIDARTRLLVVEDERPRASNELPASPEPKAS